MLPNPILIAATASSAKMAAARRRGVLAQERWHARPDVAALAGALAQCGTSPPVSVTDLAARMDRWLRCDAWLQAFMSECCAAVRDDIFAAFPFRPMEGRVVRGLALMQAPQADVSLCWVDGHVLPHALETTAIFTSTLSVIQVVKAGGLVVQSYQLDDPASDTAKLSDGCARQLVDGDILLLDNRRESIVMRHADADAVLLRFNVRLPDAAPHRSISLETGKHLATALADEQVSRMVPLLFVARLAGQAQRAAPMCATLARHPDPLLRWTAIREWLVADMRSALAVLPAVAADDPDSQVRQAAAVTLALLSRPQDGARCPA